MSCSTRRRILQRVKLEKLHCHGSLPCNIQFPWFWILVFVDARFKRMLLETTLFPAIFIPSSRDTNIPWYTWRYVQLDLLLRNELRGRETAAAPLYMRKSVCDDTCKVSRMNSSCHVSRSSRVSTRYSNAIIAYIIFRVSCKKCDTMKSVPEWNWR